MTICKEAKRNDYTLSTQTSCSNYKHLQKFGIAVYSALTEMILQLNLSFLGLALT